MTTQQRSLTGANRGNRNQRKFSVLSVPSCSIPGSLLGIEGPQDTTDLTTSKPTLAGVDQTGGVVELDFDKSISDGVNIYAKRDGDSDFVFLARDTASPYIDNRPLLVATKPELREYKAVYVQSDAEIGLFSDEVVVNCAP